MLLDRFIEGLKVSWGIGNKLIRVFDVLYLCNFGSSFFVGIVYIVDVLFG